MRYSQRFLGSTQRCFAVHLYLLGLKGKAYLLYSSSLCSSSRFVDVLIPLICCAVRLLRKVSEATFLSAELGSSLRALAFSTAPRRAETAQTNTFAERPISAGPISAGLCKAPLHACNAFNAADNFSLHRQALQTKHWAKLGRSNASKAIKHYNQHNLKEHGMARCNLWLHPIRPIGISGLTYLPVPGLQNTSAGSLAPQLQRLKVIGQDLPRWGTTMRTKVVEELLQAIGKLALMYKLTE